MAEGLFGVHGLALEVRGQRMGLDTDHGVASRHKGFALFDDRLQHRGRRACGIGLDGQGGVVIGPRTADLHIDRLFPIGDFAQFVNLDLEIVRSGPVRMAAG